MGLRSFLSDLAGVSAPTRASTLAAAAAARATSTELDAESTPGIQRALAGGRVTFDTSPFQPTFPYIQQPMDNESSWRLLDFDTNSLRKASPNQLLRMLADMSPDVSRALWDFGRLCNPNFSIQITRTKNGRSTYVKGQDAAELFLTTLGIHHGTIQTLFNTMFVNAFLSGAFFSELVLDKTARIPLDLVLPDPMSARFKHKIDPERGPIWQLGQMQNGRFIELLRPTIIYVPIDPIGEPPYGRPLASPALFTTLFLIGMLHDLKRVVAQQGWPRIDLNINTETLASMMPSDVEGDTKKMKAWVQGVVDEIKAIYSQLEPDDAYIHTDVVTVNKPQGTMNASSLSMVGDIIAVLERMACRALKTMPIMMGLSESISESNANRQWEIMQAGVRAVQQMCADMLERQFAFALQAQGIYGFVKFSFGELRAAEALRDQQIDTLKLTNAHMAYVLGYIDQVEAANRAVGHDPVLPEPKEAPTAPVVKGGAANFAQNTPESETGRTLISQAMSHFRAGTDALLALGAGSPTHTNGTNGHSRN